MEDTDIEEAREILGDTAKQLTDEQLKDICVEIQFLVESWLDEYERSVFNGKTLRELLGEAV